MTMTEFLPQYLQILLAMGLIFFSANELIRLLDQIRIIQVTRRVRKLASQRSQTPTPMQPTSAPEKAQESPVWKAEPKQEIPTRAIMKWVVIPPFPKLNWWAVTGVTFLGIVLGLAFYIMKVYQP